MELVLDMEIAIEANGPPVPCTWVVQAEYDPGDSSVGARPAWSFCSLSWADGTKIPTKVLTALEPALFDYAQTTREVIR